MTLKLGKLPARAGAYKLKFSNYATALPKPASKGGHYSLVPDWEGMLGNDQYGDCVWAGAAHETILWNKEAKAAVTFSEKSVLADYSAVTGFDPKDPNSDQGTDMQLAAKYRQRTGILDASGKRHQIGAYVEIKAGNELELKQAISLFGVCGIGIQFPSTAMDQFNAGKPWKVVKGAAIEGGHYVPAVGYDAEYIYIITWGKVQKMSWAFFKKYCDEAIVYLSTEMLVEGKSLDGYNLALLQEDLKLYVN